MLGARSLTELLETTHFWMLDSTFSERNDEMVMIKGVTFYPLF